MGFSKSQGGSTQGNSASQSNTQQRIWEGQSGPLNSLFQNAQSAYSNLAPGLAERATSLGNGATFTGAALVNDLTNSGLSEQGQGFQNILERRSEIANPYLDKQIDGLRRDIMRGFDDSLGRIGQGFVSAGQYGGGRQGLAEGQAIRGALEEFQRGGVQLRSEDLERGQRAAIAGQQGALQEMAQQNQAQGMAANFLPQLMNLGLSPYTSQLGFLSQLGNIYGDPTVLTSSQSQSASSTRGRGGDSFGINLI